MSDIKIVDAHTHIQFPQFDKDRKDVINRMKEDCIGVINVGTDIDMTKKAIELSSNYDFIWATAGIHPHQIYTDEDILELQKLSTDKNIVGIGECGLDYSRIKNDDEKEIQKELFIEHINISKKIKKPLVIHCRDAFDDVLSILKDNRGSLLEEPGIIHFFTGDVEIAKEFIDLGFSFTFGGLITNTCEFDDVLKYIPKDKLLVETDAPYVTPLKYRGKRNEPVYILETIEALSKIRGENLDELKYTLLKNTKRVFRLG